MYEASKQPELGGSMEVYANVAAVEIEQRALDALGVSTSIE